MTWKRAKTAVVATGMAVAALTSISQPAFAASDFVSLSIGNGTGKVQVDNSPGSGASWIWAYADKSLKYTDAEFYKKNDGTRYSFTAFSGTSRSMTLDKDVTAVRICAEHQTYGGRQCGSWAHPAY
jgi:hypothetical protein